MTDTVTERITGETVAEDEHVILTLDRRGDSRFSWNPQNRADVEAAREHFQKLKDKGHLAYRVRNGEKTAETISEFDPEAREIVMVPQTVGG